MKIDTRSLKEKVRLDLFLKEKPFPKMSRNQIQKMIEAGNITVNGKIPTKHHWVQNDDIVEYQEIITPKIETSLVEKMANIFSQKKAAKKIIPKNWEAIRIVEETPDYLITYKPNSISVHPGAGEELGGYTLVDWLIANKNIKKIGEDPKRPGIVHRIDKDVSGLLIVAKTQKFYEHIKLQFQGRTVIKKYLGLVIGEVINEHDVIEFKIIRSKKSGLMVCLPKNAEEGKDAKTEFIIKTHYDGFTLLDIQIHTGRTHQIRTHMRAYNYPLLGDTLYTTNKHKWSNSIKDKTKKLGRVFLQAYEIGFLNLENEEKHYTLPLDQELQSILNTLQIHETQR